MSEIIYPYLPQDREILFVSLENPWMLEAKKMADEKFGCSWWPTGAVVVKNNQIIGRGANSGTFQPLCPRVSHNCPTGEGYHFCHELCAQEGHSEVTSINDALNAGFDPTGADIYLFGHWWCCENCWKHMIQNAIKNVFLLENANEIFTRDRRLSLMDEIKKKLTAQENISQNQLRW